VSTENLCVLIRALGVSLGSREAVESNPVVGRASPQLRIISRSDVAVEWASGVINA
jgi:hypothetical protein